ncbi:MAG: hypothetical protein KBG20_10990 [Caldilineaceae bacterium]|nr:hypothetical protein [Caldilineaceae bacterium]MBP8107214.1 hypothetical protein [Caldilineaceae bacterium]MBP8122249.1 hypothetical protein [Caldilineaceae bacterium]MBP9072820.1 hypothetical protein [Caldilineaceae bacterium]
MLTAPILLALILISVFFGAASAAQVDPAAPAGLTILRADDTGITLLLDLSAHPAANPDLWDGGLTTTPGMPQVPVFSALVGVPGDVEIHLNVESATAQSVEGVDVAARFPLAPQPAPLTADLSPGQWQQADPASLQPLPGLYPATLARIGDDAWVRDQRVVRVEVYPVQVDAGGNRVVSHDRIQVRLDFVGGDISRRSLDQGKSSPTPFEAALASSLLNYDQAQAWRAPGPVQTETLSAPRQATGGGAMLKISVDTDGLYRLTPADFAAAGFSLSGMSPVNYVMTNRGQPVAIYITGQDDGTFDAGDAIYFYGERFVGDVARDAGTNFYACPQCAPSDVRQQVMENSYTDDNVYWLTWSNQPGLRMADLAQTAGSWPTPISFPESVWAEESTQWFTHHWTDKDTWFWGRVRSTAASPRSASYTTILPTPATQPFSATVTARIVSRIDRSGHHTNFGLNNQVLLDDAVWDGRTAYTFTAQVESSALISGVNTLTFTTTNDVVAASDDLYFDWFEVGYQRQFVAQADQLIFGLAQAGAFDYQIGGFSAADGMVLEITDPLHPQRVTKVGNVAGAGGAITATFQISHSAQARFVVAASPGLRTPKALLAVEPNGLRSPNNGADYLIISHSAFITGVQGLADYRAAQGLRVKVVDVADLYNEFNDGIYSPVAIRNFLAYAYATWQSPAPQYVLLVGDGHWNFKGYGTYGTDPIYMPPMLARVDPWQGEVDATNLLAAVVGDDIMPDLMIGRFPVNNEDELTAMISKTMAYESGQNLAHPAAWQRTVAFVTDNTPDAAGEFVESAEHFFQTYVTGDFQPIRLYADDYVGNPAAVTQALSKTLNVTGTLLLNYVGHGFIKGWAAENLWLTTDVPGLHNADRLPIVLSMDCLDGYWIYPGDPSLAEVMARYAGGGSVAAFSPTGLGVAVGHDDLFEGFYDYLFVDQGRILGQAGAAAKLRLFSKNSHHDLIHTFMIVGDPALRLPMPAQELYLPAVQR